MNRLIDETSTIDAERKSHTGYSYDNNGNKTELTIDIDQTGSKYFQFNYVYDFAGNLIQDQRVCKDTISNTEHGHFIQKYTRDYVGNPLSEGQFNGVGFDTIQYTYDYRNRVIEKVEPYTTGGAVKTTSYTYDKRGNPATIIQTVQGASCSTIFQYDGMDKLVKKTDPLGNISRYIYDENGNLKKEIDPRYSADEVVTAPGTEYVYDALNRLVKTTVFNGVDRTVTAYKEYDGRGNVTKVADGEGYNANNPTSSAGNTYSYDENNRVVKLISAQTQKDNLVNGTSNFTKLYTYDGSGNLLEEEDAYNQTTKYVYFFNGLLKEKIYPDDTKESYDYDLSGNICHQ